MLYFKKQARKRKVFRAAGRNYAVTGIGGNVSRMYLAFIARDRKRAFDRHRGVPRIFKAEYFQSDEAFKRGRLYQRGRKRVYHADRIRASRGGKNLLAPHRAFRFVRKAGRARRRCRGGRVPHRTRDFGRIVCGD